MIDLLDINKNNSTMSNKPLKYTDITELILKCAFKVHNILGSGFQEVIYQRALEIEFSKINLSFSREFEMNIIYDEIQIGTRRVDFLVESKISVELKTMTNLEPLHLAQGLNYLEAYNLEVGMLINFGSRSLEYKRLLNKKFKSIV